ncbi:MAG TPA: ABC transporter permease [Thermoanaerobaculia bacterium]
MNPKSLALVFCGLLALSTVACREQTYQLWNEEDQAPWMRNLLAAEVRLPVTGTEAAEELSQLLGRAASIPGVAQAAVVDVLPGAPAQRHLIGIKHEGSISERPPASLLVVSPGYFETLELRLLRGRLFSERDQAGSPHVAIVGESYSRLQNPHGEELLGKRVQIGWRSGPLLTIVGIVQDGPGGEQVSELYVPYSQHAALGLGEGNRDSYLLVRTSGGDQTGISGALQRDLGVEFQPIQERLKAYADAREQ